jgi:hypothetical protein
MGSSWASGLGCVSTAKFEKSPVVLTEMILGQIDREGNARKVVNCSCVVVKDWGEESQERSILLNYFQTEQ